MPGPPIKTPAVKTLEERYEKLKIKEAKLEADLAIRECPELQRPIAEVILAYVDARKAWDEYQLVAPLGPPKSRLDAANAQIKLWRDHLAKEVSTGEEADKRRAFYQSKLTAAEAAVSEIVPDRSLALKTKYSKALTTLQETYNRLKPLFDEHMFKWEYLLPSVVKYLERKVDP